MVFLQALRRQLHKHWHEFYRGAEINMGQTRQMAKQLSWQQSRDIHVGIDDCLGLTVLRDGERVVLERRRNRTAIVAATA